MIFPSSAGMPLNKPSLGGNNLIFPARKGLVSDIPARDGKIDNLFFTVTGFSYIIHSEVTLRG
jgi:hypothetical protein